LQVLDGILCHDGELHLQDLEPRKGKSFVVMEEEIMQKGVEPSLDIWPMTLEGCVVRMADTISYIGRDIDDAIRLGLIERKDIPEECRNVLGDTNGTIVYTLVEDLVANSLNMPHVCFSEEVGGALKKLKEFNYEYLYKSDKVKKQTHKVKLMFELLFAEYLNDLEKGNASSDIQCEFLEGMSDEYRSNTPNAGVVRDFIAGMTDDYFLSQCNKRFVPEIRPGLF
jgi:dGTPase